MNTDLFKDCDCFTLLDLEACYSFKTETSILFQLGRHSRSRSAFSVRGWLDVHHPVQTSYGTKAYLRIALPRQYFDFEDKHLLLDQQKEVVATVFNALGIAAAEVYEALFFAPDNEQNLFVEEPGIFYRCG